MKNPVHKYLYTKIMPSDSTFKLCHPFLHTNGYLTTTSLPHGSQQRHTHPIHPMRYTSNKMAKGPHKHISYEKSMPTHKIME